MGKHLKKKYVNLYDVNAVFNSWYHKLEKYEVLQDLIEAIYLEIDELPKYINSNESGAE